MSLRGKPSRVVRPVLMRTPCYSKTLIAYLAYSPDLRTESSTCPNAFNYASTRSFSAMSSWSVSCSFAMPFE